MRSAGAAGTVRSKINHNLNAEEPAMHQPEEAIDLTPEERAIIEQFDAAPYPPEVAVHRLIEEFHEVFDTAFARAAECLARILPTDEDRQR